MEWEEKRILRNTNIRDIGKGEGKRVARNPEGKPGEGRSPVTEVEENFKENEVFNHV